jgi:DNA mismatch repair protein MutL
LTTLKEEKEIKKLERELEIEPPISKPLDFSTLKIIGVAFNTYILASAGDELFLIDQHAAHERIFYEKLLRQYNSEEKYRQTLLAPLRFSVTAATAGQEDLWIEPLRKMGYSVELFGTRTYIVREIPAFMSLKEAESFLKDMFASIEDKADLTNTAALDKIISRSCKSAIKGGDSLNIAEIDALIEELESCINPFSCPHGRPTFIRITKREIEKMFKRV